MHGDYLNKKSMTLEDEILMLKKRLAAAEHEIEKLKGDDYEPEDFDEDDYYDEDDLREQELERLYDLAASCKCGAWQSKNNGTVVHVADCCCGAE